MSGQSKVMLDPHPDIELGWNRKEIDLYITEPDSTINEDTGLLVLIDDFGGRADSFENQDQIRPMLAEKYNCIVAGVNYFGIFRNRMIQIRPDFIHNINRIYQTNITAEDLVNAMGEDEIYRIIAKNIISKGITSVDVRCQPTLVTGREEYQSWGLLPAIDCLQAVGEVLRRYPSINHRKLIVYGSGYGAYIAMLMGKFAPNTFSIIIDKEGYCRAELKHIACGEVMEPDYVYAFNIRFSDLKFTIAAGSNNPWTIENEMAGSYFSDSHRKVRSLFQESHMKKSETRYYMIHSAEDSVASIDDKDRFVNLLSDYNKVFYNRIPRSELTAEQALSNDDYLNIANMTLFRDIDIIDWVFKVDKNGMAKESEKTDFDLNSEFIFPCGEKTYKFKFNDSFQLKVII